MHLFLLCLTCFLLAFGQRSSHAERPSPPMDTNASTRLLTIDAAYRLARQNNPTLEAMSARVQEAEAEAQRAWAQIKPKANLMGTFTHSQYEIGFDPNTLMPPGSPPQDPVIIQKENQFGFRAGIDLPLFRGPAYHQIGAAQKASDAAQLRYTWMRQGYLLRVAQAYYRTLGIQEAIAAITDKVAVDEENLRSAQARLDVGQTLRSDVMRAELVLTQDRQLLTEQQFDLIAAKRTLALLVGLAEDVEVTRPEEPHAAAGSRHEMFLAAVEQRADVRATRTDTRAAEQAKTAAWWSFLPMLDLNFAYQWQEAQGFVPEQGYYTLLLSVLLPIYDGGIRYADLRKAQAQISQTTAREAEIERDVALEVVRLENALLSAESALVSATKAVGLAKLTAEEMAARYTAGTATQLDVLDATQRQLDAQIDLTRARYARDLARLAIAYALGTFDPGSEEG